MNSKPIDPETLAAFVDGKLPAHERENVLAELARGGESYENLLEVVAIQGELARESAAPGSGTPPDESGSAWVFRFERPPVARRVRRSWMAAGGMAIAAGIVAILFLRQPSIGAADGSLMLALSADAPATVQTLGAGWYDETWSAVRGGAEAVDSRVRAFRGGARFSDLELGIAGRDSMAAATIVRGLSQLASTADAGTLVAPQIDRIGMLSTSAERAKVAATYRDMFDVPVWFDLGSWVEAARLSAASGHADFFATNGTAMRRLHEVLTAVEKVPAQDLAPIRASVDRVRGLEGRSVTSAELPAIAAVLDSTLKEIGR